MFESTSLPAPAEPWRLSDHQLATALVEQERVLRRAHAHILRLLAEGERRGLGRALGYHGMAGLLREELHLSAREARARLADAAHTQPRSGLSGETRPAPLADAEVALAAGAIGPEHVRALGEIVDRCPAALPDAARAASLRTLLDLATQASPDEVRRAGRHLLAYWQADGQPPGERDLATPARTFRYRHRRNGDLEFSGTLDAETGATLEGLFGPLAKPRPAGENGAPDDRTAEQRHGDALAEIIECAARADDLTVQGGERAVLTATITVTELENRANRAVLDVPGHTSLDQLRRLACEARIVPAILGRHGEPLHLGRGARLATTAQRRALALRDRGCALPGCDRGPKWTVAHHVVAWQHGGTTDIDLLVLLCARHHRVIHHTDWQVRINPADGLPEFVPPTRMDPHRRPLRNGAHHAASTAAAAHLPSARPDGRTNSRRRARGQCAGRARAPAP
ncbi:uncharacterized protein DUF222 [Prauserella shujinwangii]|uniref:Uncharacterized protein DUF222 n=1 Tax=Prauserella shujinwangii TaxID=1453103 RepID=A0A2T0LU02_9PSEU|nr:HNH endonuclease signature motif containing protein [Prauserella shujinwangii]PRX47219.1 uncharacterized protein DUF222 [Prauserella shujinwangii]